MAGQPKRRDRVLSDAEPYGKIVKLLILTGARREEVGGMLWSELDKRPLWIISASRTKNRLEHILTLPRLAWSIIDGTSRRESNKRILGNGPHGFNNWNTAKKALDRRSGIVSWRLHDLRRTAATRMADLGIQPHIIESVLNHVSGHKAGVAGVYNRSVYTREVKNAPAIWADHVASIVSGEQRTVVPFARGGQ